MKMLNPFARPAEPATLFRYPAHVPAECRVPRFDGARGRSECRDERGLRLGYHFVVTFYVRHRNTDPEAAPVEVPVARQTFVVEATTTTRRKEDASLVSTLCKLQSGYPVSYVDDAEKHYVVHHAWPHRSPHVVGGLYADLCPVPGAEAFACEPTDTSPGATVPHK